MENKVAESGGHLSLFIFAKTLPQLKLSDLRTVIKEYKNKINITVIYCSKHLNRLKLLLVYILCEVIDFKLCI